MSKIMTAEELLRQMCDYLDDTHPQGSKSAIAVNIISSTSEFHKQMREVLSVQQPPIDVEDEIEKEYPLFDKNDFHPIGSEINVGISNQKVEQRRRDFRKGYTLAMQKRQMEGWISIHSKTPDINQYVLAIMKSGSMVVCKYCLIFSEFEYVASAMTMTIHITHWQPLPAPPTK